MTLQQQLNYNWERGFYSVVKDRMLQFGIVTTKTQSGSFWFSGWNQSIDACMERIGLFPLQYMGNGEGIEIVDTIHPSELMGKGFQVGDKVLFKDGEEDRIATITGHWNDYGLIDIEWLTENDIVSLNVSLKDLKPVLPVEEKVDMNGKKDKKPVSLEDKLVTSTLNVEFDSGTPQVTLGYEISQRSHICNCGFWNSEKVWGETLYTQQFGDSCKSMSITNNYVVCSKCGERLRRVKVTYLDDIGKDGHIANL